MLRRHQLAHLAASGWREVLDSDLPAAAREPLADWAERGLPLVVPRQPEALSAARIALAWAGPLASGRCRVAVEVAAKSVAWFAEFPDARTAVPLAPRRARPGLRALLARLAQRGARPRVYGSYGWQVLSGLPYLREGSDLDLWCQVASADEADAVVAALQSAATASLRIDGELLFPDGAAVAWREYAAWRDGTTRSLLVKRLRSVALATALPLPAWCEAMAA